VVLFLVAACIAACSTAGPASAPSSRRSTSDVRVKDFQGRVPPDVFTGGTWVGSAGPTSLAALQGRVVYLQFAFHH
jgi:hypothetical protein